MIKVNLLRGQTAPKRGGPALPKKPFSRTPLLFLAAIALPLAGVAAYWYSLKGEVATLTTRRDQLRTQSRRLEDLKKQLAEFEKKKLERQNRIQVIEQLKENQTGPVLLLSHVIQSIPTDATLWLTNLDQKGERVQITGFTRRGESIPDFMSNLAGSGYFRTVDLELYEDQQRDKQAAKFVLVCTTNFKAPTE
jgi:Tfp pilus assembly protein PilN